LNANLDLVDLAVEGRRREAEQVLLMEFIGDRRERERQIVGCL
jgi:hypothetical protein